MGYGVSIILGTSAHQLRGLPFLSSVLEHSDLKKKKNEALEGIQRQAMRMIYGSGNDLCGKVKSTGEKQGKGDLMTVLKHSILHIGD